MAFSHQGGIIRGDVVVALGQNCSPFPSQKFVGILSGAAGATILLLCSVVHFLARTTLKQQ